MKTTVYGVDGKQHGQTELPSQFSETVRKDIILRAFRMYRAGLRQPHGSLPEAGKRASAKLSRRRRDYKGAYGIGISRVSRKTVWHRGTQFGWVGAVAPLTVGGRRAHPPKASEIHAHKINKRERRLALRSALAATTEPALVRARGHAVETSTLPIVIVKDAEALASAKQVATLFNHLGLGAELERCGQRKVRAGKGKMRGRRYRERKGVLVVVSGDCKLAHAARNLPGVDVTNIKQLNIDLLAPGGVPGRLLVVSEAALAKMREENLFIDS